MRKGTERSGRRRGFGREVLHKRTKKKKNLLYSLTICIALFVSVLLISTLAVDWI